MKIRFVSVIIGILLLMTTTCSLADEITPRADLVFQNATATLCSGKYVVFSALTYDVADLVSVTSVQLERKVNGNWSYVADLACPPDQTSCFRYSQTKYYTSEISSGTYRVVVTFCADGHSITRTSNVRTY